MGIGIRHRHNAILYEGAIKMSNKGEQYRACACGSDDWIYNDHIIVCANAECEYNQPVVGASHWNMCMKAIATQPQAVTQGEE